MGKHTNDDIESSKIDNNKAKSLLIKLGVIILTVGVLYGVGSMFLSMTSPEEPEIITGEELAKIIIPPIIEYTAQDDPDIEYVKDKPVVYKVESHGHEHDYSKMTMVPMTILDMVYFINDHPELTDEESNIIMSYAVGKETGMFDAEVDHQAYHVMEKLQ